MKCKGFFFSSSLVLINIPIITYSLFQTISMCVLISSQQLTDPSLLHKASLIYVSLSHKEFRVLSPSKRCPSRRSWQRNRVCLRTKKTNEPVFYLNIYLPYPTDTNSVITVMSEHTNFSPVKKTSLS